MSIKYKDDGHVVSERTSQESLEILKREIKSLSVEEREALLAALDEVTDDQESSLYNTIEELEWRERPVDIRTFVTDPHYLGNSCDTLYPQWLDDLEELFADGTYREVVLTGSIGCGKTFAASIGVCYMLHRLGCMRDPHRSFGLAANSNISLVCLSVNEVLATKVAYENIATKIESSPWFQENFPFTKTKKELRFPRKIWVAARATTDGSVLGLNVIGGLLDETNFMKKAKSNDPRFNVEGQAAVLYNAMQRRMKSRFERRGQLPGMLFVVSSKQTDDDFTAQRVRESINDPTIFVRDYSVWEVKPKEYYSGEWFHVMVGNEASPSRILNPDEDPEKTRHLMADGCVLIEVPIEYKQDFEKDLDGSIRDLAGVSTVAVSPYISHRDKIEQAINHTRRHPFSREFFDPSQRGDFLWNKMVAQVVERDYGDTFTPTLRPILNPHAARHIHIDPSATTDSTGFCMAHIGGWMDVKRRQEDGSHFAERAPIIVVDLILRIVPPIGDEIQMGDIRRMIYRLAAKGYLITKVTADSWNTREMIQKLHQKGYNAEVLSVDRTMSPYECLKNAIYEGRMDVYDYPILIKELRELEHDRVKRKIDHPVKGSKDCSDALAGVCFSLTENSLKQPMPMLPSTPMYSGDAWMQEQLHHAAAQNARQAAQDLSQGPLGPGQLPAFFLGTDAEYDWDKS